MTTKAVVLWVLMALSLAPPAFAKNSVEALVIRIEKLEADMAGLKAENARLRKEIEQFRMDLDKMSRAAHQSEESARVRQQNLEK